MLQPSRLDRSSVHVRARHPVSLLSARPPIENLPFGRRKNLAILGDDHPGT